MDIDPQPAPPASTPAMDDSTAAAVRRVPLPSRLRGVRFKGPVAKITTVDSPLRPPAKP